jgi:hypothetical protein
MAKVLLAFDAVRRVGLTLPGVTDGTMYGSPALKVHGNLLACVPVNKSAEPNCAAFRIDFDLRASLIKRSPEIYYVTDHYANHPIVLVRLSRIEPKELRELLGLAWNFVSAKKPTRNSSANASRTGPDGRIPSRERPAIGKPSGRRQ